MFKNIDKFTKTMFIVFIIIGVIALGMSMVWQANYDATHSTTEIESNK